MTRRNLKLFELRHERFNLDLIRQIPIIEVAECLGIKVLGSKALCFSGHDKRTLSLNFRRSHNTWRCFGCGKHGDAINLVEEVEGLDFIGAATWLSERFSIPINGLNSFRPSSRPSSRIKPQTQPVRETAVKQKVIDSEVYEWLINSCPHVSSPRGIEYLSNHCISPECAARFNIRELENSENTFGRLLQKWGAERLCSNGLMTESGAYGRRPIWKSHALLFPCIEQGRIKNIQARNFDGQSKFLSLQGIPSMMFNADQLRNLKPGRKVHICEGAPDTVALECNGWLAVGVLGASSFRTEWVERFLKFEVVVLGDGDDAGRQFMKDVSEAFMSRGKLVKCMHLPEGQDVCDVLANSKR